jgi:hypothetical protein
VVFLAGAKLETGFSAGLAALVLIWTPCEKQSNSGHGEHPNY